MRWLIYRGGVLFVSGVAGLQCFSCETSRSWSECFKNELKCPKSKNSCYKARYMVDNIKYYNKGCVAGHQCNQTQYCSDLEECKVSHVTLPRDSKVCIAYGIIYASLSLELCAMLAGEFASDVTGSSHCVAVTSLTHINLMK